jgi:flagellum-specific ATP synthase
MHNVVSREHFELARRFRAIYSRYERGRDLIQIGAYAQGSDPALDEAIALHDGMSQFLQQDMYQAAPAEYVLDELLAATSLGVGAA